MSLYDEFIKDKKKGTLKLFDKLSREELKRLFWDEQKSNLMIAELFDVNQKCINKGKNGAYYCKIYPFKILFQIL